MLIGFEAIEVGVARAVHAFQQVECSRTDVWLGAGELRAEKACRVGGVAELVTCACERVCKRRRGCRRDERPNHAEHYVAIVRRVGQQPVAKGVCGRDFTHQGPDEAVSRAGPPAPQQAYEEPGDRRAHRVEVPYGRGQPFDRRRHGGQVARQTVALQEALDDGGVFVHGHAIPRPQLAHERAVRVGRALVLAREVHRQRLCVRVQLQLLLRGRRPCLRGCKAAALVGELRHRKLVVRIRDVELVPQCVEPVHLPAGDHPAVEAVADG